MEKKPVIDLVEKLKASVKKEIKRNNYEMALELIYDCAGLLYHTNIYYVDDELENDIFEISKRLDLSHKFDKLANTLIFYDGFGLNDRGLAQIYLDALCKLRDVIYVTYEDRKNNIPDLLNIIDEHDGCKALYLKRNKHSFTKQIEDLNKILVSERPSEFFFYSVPNDVVATTVMNSYAGSVERYQVNLTDHAFWLGARCIDICIEFRDYGASVSKKYRKIPENFIIKLPFYPQTHPERKFQGYPFNIAADQKVIFSGGALYKTNGGDNKYYKIVDYILSSHDDVIFWYAGQGDDTELKKIINKYPNRVYHTEERSDLFQILRHSRLYLNTYPFIGGLMSQYAASAGRIPVTLKPADDRSSGFLQNQSQIEFESLDAVYKEIDKIICDDEYFNSKEKEIVRWVSTKKQFLENLRAILDDDKSGLLYIEYSDIDTDLFRKEYLERLNNADINMMLVNKATYKTAIQYVPLRFMIGCFYKFRWKMQHK